MRPAFLLFLCALTLTLAMSAPVLESPAQRLIGRETVGRHHDAYTMVRQFEDPLPLGHPVQQPVTDLAGAAVAKVTGGVVAYNVVVLISFPLAALFAFLLARHFSLPVGASAFAGLAFAFAPSHLAHAAYHPHIVQTQWIPLYFLALCRCLERWTVGRAAGLLAAAGLMTLASFYFGFLAALLTPVAVLAYGAARGGSVGGGQRLAASATLGVGVALGAVVLRLSPAKIAGLYDVFGFPATDLERYTARWFSYLLPPVDHPLAGDRVSVFWAERQVADGLIEQQLTVGLALVALAGLAVAWRQRLPGRLAGGGVILPLALAATAFVLSLAGPVPALLHAVVPVFRAYGRLGIFVQLMLALLAAAGLDLLIKRGPAGRVAAVLLSVLLAVEYAPFPPWRWHPVLPTEGHRWLAEQEGPWRLLDCVATPPPVAHSVFQFLPQPAAQLSDAVPDCAEPGLAPKLAALGFSHLLVRPGSAEDRWYARRATPGGLVELGPFADCRLLRVDAHPSDLHVASWRGFSWREYGGDETFRWLGESGEWSVVVRGSEPVAAELEVELHAFPESRRLDVTLDGADVATLEVSTEPAVHRIGPLIFAPGTNRLGWRPRAAAVVADEVLANGDARALSIAVGDWRWAVSRPE